MGRTRKDLNSLIPSEPVCGPWSMSLPRESGSDAEDTLLKTSVAASTYLFPSEP